jgi:hypothetical protein
VTWRDIYRATRRLRSADNSSSINDSKSSTGIMATTATIYQRTKTFTREIATIMTRRRRTTTTTTTKTNNNTENI